MSQTYALALRGPEERQLLNEIGDMARRVKHLRSTSARNVVPAKALEVELRAKWAALRALRAGPSDIDPHAPRTRSLYR